MWPKHEIKRVWDNGVRHYDGFFGVTSVLSATKPESAKRAIEKWREGKTQAELEAPALRGTAVHDLVERLQLGEDPEIPPQYRGYIESAKTYFQMIERTHLLEGGVWSPRGYAGTVDQVADLRTRRSTYTYIVDIKTAARNRPFRHDSLVQVAAYAGAVNYVYKTRINRGKVILLTPKGMFPRDIAPQEMGNLWREWLTRLETYKSMRLNQAQTS